ncbi:pyridoxal phosphate-dependent aminotransferase [Leptotrichia sp. oral taxon 847]|uniref:pyridoxal phosphate-dependent aminotransferase n=1 Tax=Leptotrichia sp. oral taxon 847 TaxID=1785996 RepID=UPI000767F096|nr:aminotransferase class I/II-fold pyridoxal phosphate-dependent enzyme [Leptotrichia sp. oral taxon 847]AMD94288.1 aminotransferase class I/II [Leptotrichia sp. oral taxon 847]
MYIDPIIKGIEISDIRKIHERLSAYKDVINMTIGEPDIDTPQKVKEAIAYHALNSPIKYSPVGGMPILREKIAKFYNEKFEGNYKKDNVLVTVGSTEGLSSTLKTILAEDDEVLIPTPAYVGYEPLIRVARAKTIFMDLEENNFILTEKILEKYITPKTKLIILTYPNNPSGITLPEEEIIKIVKFLKDKEIYILSDEIYASIAFEKFTSFAKYYNELKEQLIIVNGFSKSHSMTGHRLGYTLANKKLQAQVKKISQYTVTSASTLSQYGAIAALDYCSDTTELSEVYKKRVFYFMEELEKLGFKCLKPKGAFYVFATYKTIDKFKDVDSFDFVLNLLKKTELAIVPGITFQVEGYLRFSIVHDIPVLKEAIARLKDYIEFK